MFGRVTRSIANLARYLAGLAARMAGMRGQPVHAPDTTTWFRSAFADDVRRSFSGSHTPDGDPWAPLKYRQGRPLILTGALMAAAVGAASRATLVGREVLAEIGQPFYWRFHEYGTRRIPARPFFYPSPATLLELTRRVAEDAAARVLTDESGSIVGGR